MRLFLLPISTRQSLIYCQRINKQISAETTWIDKITTKASATWLKWERKDSGWQNKVTTYGNTLFQRLPYQEWGLKSIPPLSARRRGEEIEGKEVVQLEFPEALLESQKVQDALEMYGSDEKQGFHAKWMWGSILGMPITAPLALIPIIPNLPFFYLCFRAWSHWRAWGGSQHIEFLLQNKLVRTSPSAALGIAYGAATMDTQLQDLRMRVKTIGSSSDSESRPNANEEKMLLSESSGQQIADCIQVPELAVEIKRAVWQVERSLKARQEYQEEKQEMDRATKKSNE